MKFGELSKYNIVIYNLKNILLYTIIICILSIVITWLFKEQIITISTFVFTTNPIRAAFGEFQNGLTKSLFFFIFNSIIICGIIIIAYILYNKSNIHEYKYNYKNIIIYILYGILMLLTFTRLSAYTMNFGIIQLFNIIFPHAFVEIPITMIITSVGLSIGKDFIINKSTLINFIIYIALPIIFVSALLEFYW